DTDLCHPVGHVLGCADAPHALPVIPAARGLGDYRPAHLGTEAGDLAGGPCLTPAGHVDAELAEPPPHGELVLGVHEGGGPGVKLDAVGLQRLQDRWRHVLVVEGHDVAAACPGAHRPEVGVVAHR